MPQPKCHASLCGVNKRTVRPEFKVPDYYVNNMYLGIQYLFIFDRDEEAILWLFP